MDMSTVTSLIGSLGFPIVCCIVMFYQNSKMQETLSALTTTLSTMNERLSSVEDAIKERNEEDESK